jgi:hypothetical protein
MPDAEFVGNGVHVPILECVEHGELFGDLRRVHVGVAADRLVVPRAPNDAAGDLACLRDEVAVVGGDASWSFPADQRLEVGEVFLDLSHRFRP